MQVGICCSGVGPAAAPAFVKASAQAAERAGFSTIWIGEHVVLFDAYPASKYPYAGDYGTEVPIPDPTMPIIDPIIASTWIAAVTTTIQVGSGILILPQRNPVVLSKELATLDVLSGGRLVLGAGVGWCKEEYDAIGIPWEGRGKRMDDNLSALRALWRESSATFKGETVGFEAAYCYPKPVRNSDIPILIGGESDLALRRVARHGDGWIAFKLSAEEAPARVELLRRLMREQGRNPDRLRIVVGIFSHTSEDELKRYRDAGVTEFNLVTTGLPLDDAGIEAGMADLGRRFVDVAAKL
jgi:probable F420-dependent oxidoreductase